MKFHDITMVGPFTNEKLTNTPSFNTNTDPGRLIWLVDGTLWYASLTKWIRIGNIYNADTVTYVNQPNHGFQSGTITPVRFNGTLWVSALANSVNTCATHVVGYVVNNDYFITVQTGRIEIPNQGLLIANYYFTSASTAGTLTSTEPIVISNPMIYVEDDTYVSVLSYRPCKYE